MSASCPWALLRVCSPCLRFLGSPQTKRSPSKPCVQEPLPGKLNLSITLGLNKKEEKKKGFVELPGTHWLEASVP